MYKILVPFLILILYSCTPKISQNENLQYGVEIDSLCMDKEYTEKIISVGDQISSCPVSSQVVVIDNKEKYLLLDESVIYIFDWEKGMLEDSILLKSCGRLKNYSGFRYNTEDSILVYNYPKKELYFVDVQGKIKSKWNLKDKKNKVDVEAINGTQPICCKSKIILSGAKLGDISSVAANQRGVSTSIDLKNGEECTIFSYPESYDKSFWGGVYMNTVYHAYDGVSCMFYSFPIDHNIYRYNVANNKCDTIYMGSRYTQKICSSGASPIDLFTDKNERIIYYVKEHSYGNILYDRYRGLILRMAEHPRDEMNADGTFIKPFSVVVWDVKNKKLSESLIFKDHDKLNLGNMHVCKEGLAIAEINKKDESKIVFRCYKLR